VRQREREKANIIYIYKMANQPIPFEKQLEKILETRNYQNLLLNCQQKELDDVGQNKGDSEIFYSLQMISYLHLNELASARYLWKRLSKEFKKSKDLQALWKICAALLRKDANQFYSAVEAKDLSKIYRPFIAQLKDITRARYETAISNTYTSITLANCAEQLGLSKPQAIEYVTRLQWVVDKDLVLPIRAPAPKQQETSVTQLHQLTNYITHLEEK